jgi:Uma2 family endonuclease
MTAPVLDPPVGLEPAPPPTGLFSDEPELESTVHLMQMIVLLTSLRWAWRGRQDYFAAGNLSVYFSTLQARNKDFRGPDFFVVLGTSPRPRDAWVVWEEDGLTPDVIVEILSPSTAENDRGEKRRVYERVLRTPEYVMFEPATGTLEVLRHAEGHYHPVSPDAAGRYPSRQLGLSFGVHEGMLRLFTADGALVPTPEEAATHEAARATQEAERAERLAERLRALGQDPDREP